MKIGIIPTQGETGGGCSRALGGAASNGRQQLCLSDPQGIGIVDIPYWALGSAQRLRGGLAKRSLRTSVSRGAGRAVRAILLALTVFALLPRRGVCGDASALPRLTYTKVLKGSVPEFLSITVDVTGSGTYEGRRLSDPPSPRCVKLSAATTQRLFGLAGALNNFNSVELESHKKVANLGLKTLTYEGEGQKHQVEFNYTQRREATELGALLEKIAAVQQHILTLERAIKYDHLSLPKELLRIRIDLEKKALTDTEPMVPVLEEIARNPKFLHLAQARAQDILRRLRTSDNQ